MKKSRYMIGWYLFIITCIVVGCLCGCSWQQRTRRAWDANGNLREYEYINSGCIAREFSSDGSTLESYDNYRLELNHKSKSSKVKVAAPYGTGTVE